MQSREQSRLRQIGSIFSSAAVSVGRVRWTWGDAVALSFICAGLYFALRLALSAPMVIHGPSISLSPAMLPLYAGLSFLRMLTAYLISLAFSLWYGSLMASNKRLEQFLLPLLDVLQSVPILSFLPVVLLGLSAFLSQETSSEFASVVLIFTSQACNLAFAWYQAQKTVPRELREVSSNFQFSPWMKFRTMELPFAAISLVWNTVMSWAGGWFFLMAAEIFTVGNKDFRLPGLGAYLSQASNAGNVQAITWGLATLIFMIVALDQLIWRPLMAWSDRFKLEMTETDQEQPQSWFFEAWRKSRVIGGWLQRLARRLSEPIEERLERAFQKQQETEP